MYLDLNLKKTISSGSLVNYISISKEFILLNNDCYCFDVKHKKVFCSETVYQSKHNRIISKLV